MAFNITTALHHAARNGTQPRSLLRRAFWTGQHTHILRLSGQSLKRQEMRLKTVGGFAANLSMSAAGRVE
jgi:hypothetical protein